MDFVTLAADTVQQVQPLIGNAGIGAAGLMIGVGIGVAGAARGIGNIGGSAVEAIARQPEAKGSIGTNMIIAAALIEGFTFFALIICIMMQGVVSK
jgi:F-type H+-transporting ATPase subunit c